MLGVLAVPMAGLGGGRGRSEGERCAREKECLFHAIGLWSRGLTVRDTAVHRRPYDGAFARLPRQGAGLEAQTVPAVRPGGGLHSPNYPTETPFVRQHCAPQEDRPHRRRHDRRHARPPRRARRNWATSSCSTSPKAFPRARRWTSASAARSKASTPRSPAPTIIRTSPAPT